MLKFEVEYYLSVVLCCVFGIGISISISISTGGVSYGFDCTIPFPCGVLEIHWICIGIYGTTYPLQGALKGQAACFSQGKDSLLCPSPLY